MFAVPRRAVAVAALAAALPSPALASPYTDAVETAVFTLCPRLQSGQISPRRPTALTRLGYRRTPEIEEDWTDAEDGAPFIFTRGSGADAVTVAYWPYPQLCNVIFGGDRATAAMAQVKARIARAPRVYRRVPAAEWSSEAGRHEAWRVVRRPPMCLAIDTPAAEGELMSYEVSFEPLPPLQPALAISACAPARAPQTGRSPL